MILLTMGLDFWSSTWLVDNILSTYIGYRLTIYCQPITYIGWHNIVNQPGWRPEVKPHRGKCYVFTQYRKFWVNSLHDENVQEGDDYMNYIGNMVTYLFPLNVNIYRPFSIQCRKFWLNLLMKKMFKKESQMSYNHSISWIWLQLKSILHSFLVHEGFLLHRAIYWG